MIQCFNYVQNTIGQNTSVAHVNFSTPDGCQMWTHSWSSPKHTFKGKSETLDLCQVLAFKSQMPIFLILFLSSHCFCPGGNDWGIKSALELTQEVTQAGWVPLPTLSSNYHHAIVGYLNMFEFSLQQIFLYWYLFYKYIWIVTQAGGSPYPHYLRTIIML